MTTTVANQQPRINLANGGSMQSAQVVTLKSGQQNASSVDSKSPMHSFELRTSSTLPRCSRATGNPEVILKLALVGVPPGPGEARRHLAKAPARDIIQLNGNHAGSRKSAGASA